MIGFMYNVSAAAKDQSLGYVQLITFATEASTFVVTETRILPVNLHESTMYAWYLSTKPYHLVKRSTNTFIKTFQSESLGLVECYIRHTSQPFSYPHPMKFRNFERYFT